jgi:WS/DGAT/MGAT family acyltransferase
MGLQVTRSVRQESVRPIGISAVSNGQPAALTVQPFAADRLSPLDNMFLLSESSNAHMHIAMTAVFRSTAITGRDDGDIEPIRRYVASRLHLVPRYRQRLAFPLTGPPRWIDDASFDIRRHVRSIRVAPPGDDSQLQSIVGELLSRPLDRTKPLWEIWIVKGLAKQRFAMITKVHHCMMDGVSGAAILQVILQPFPQTIPAPSPPFRPRPAPPSFTMLYEEIGHRMTLMSAALKHPARTLHDLGDGLSAVAGMLPAGLRPAGYTSINRPVGPHRSFDWLIFDLRAVKEVKNALGGSINDVVLATAAGAVRRFLRQRGAKVDGLDFRALVPVNVRAEGDCNTLGNRVAAWIIRLPLAEPAAARRLNAICEATTHLRQSDQTKSAELFRGLGEWTGQSLLSAAIRLAFLARPFNLIITNVPGPQLPLYVLDAELVAAYPQVPLFSNQDLGVALFSYNGQLYWGFAADRDQVPDLRAFVDAIDASFRELCDAARVFGSAPSRHPPVRITAMRLHSAARSAACRTRRGEAQRARA